MSKIAIVNNSVPNRTIMQVSEAPKVIVLFSYVTPVAMSVDNVYFVVESEWSQTTKRHIEYFVGDTKCFPTTQENIETWLTDIVATG